MSEDHEFDSLSVFHQSIRNEPTEEDRLFFGELIGDSPHGGAELVSCWYVWNEKLMLSLIVISFLN